MTAQLIDMCGSCNFGIPASPATTKRLGAALSIHDFARGTVLARRGDAPKYIHFLEAGYVGTAVTSPQGHDYIIALFTPGDLFLLGSVMQNTPYPTSATVLQDSRIAMVPAELFRACVETDLTLAVGVAKVFAAQQVTMAIHIRDLKLQPPAQRLATFLLSLAEDSHGSGELTLPCDRRILAGWLGLVPASVSRAFHELERLGVTGHGRRISVASRERLQTFARGGYAAP